MQEKEVAVDELVELGVVSEETKGAVIGFINDGGFSVKIH